MYNIKLTELHPTSEININGQNSITCATSENTQTTNIEEHANIHYMCVYVLKQPDSPAPSITKETKQV